MNDNLKEFNRKVLSYFEDLKNIFEDSKQSFNKNYSDMAKFQDHLDTFYQYRFVGKGIYIFSIDLNFNVNNPLFKLQFLKDGKKLVKSLELTYSALEKNEHNKINNFYINNTNLCNEFLESKAIK